MLRVAGCEVRATRSGLRVAGCEVRVTGSGLRVVGYGKGKLKAKSSKLKAERHTAEGIRCRA